jgi:tight adherence protein B
MISEAVKIILFQIIIIVLAISIIYIIFKNLKSYEYEKKFSDFSLLSNKDADISFFDRLHIYFWQAVHKLSEILKLSKVFTKHSKKYEKNIYLDYKNIKDPMDYISIKIFVGIAFVLLYSFTVIFQYLKLDIMKIIIIFIIGYLLPNIIINYRHKKRCEKIEEDLLKAIIIMNNSFKSGRNIMQAIETVKNELDGPIALEFKKISLDISYGLSLDTVFNRFYNRVKIEDAKYIASSLTLLNKTGGNIVRVFSMIEQSFFDKKKLKDELDSLTASSVFVFRLLVFLPLIFVLVINILNKDYFKPLYSSLFGGLLLIIIISLYILYIMIIKKVLKVDM